MHGWKFWAPAIVGGSAAAVLDISYAFASAAVTKGLPPDLVLKIIASGIFGRDAFAGGWPMAVAGAVLHLAMAIVMAALFLIACRTRARSLGEHPLLSGPLYGVAIYFVMQEIVLPLSAVPLPSPRPPINFSDLAAHMFLVGLPIAVTIQRGVAGAFKPNLQPMPVFDRGL